jgi:hypothetical protein
VICFVVYVCFLGLGDFLFRHIVGVDDFCPLYAIPCESYRPDLALSYQFNIVRNAKTNIPSVDLLSMRAWPSQHTLNQTHLLVNPSGLKLLFFFLSFLIVFKKKKI